MKLVLVNEKLINKVLATPIYNQDGKVFLNKGYVFTDSMIERIKNFGINTTYIEDENNDLSVQHVLDMSIKLKNIGILKQVFERAKKERKIEEKIISSMVDEMIDNVNLSENAFIFNDIIKNSGDIDIYIHSIDVCILSIIIGINREYNKKQLKNLAMAALLHDIGKMFSDGEKHAEEGYKFIKGVNAFPTTVYMTICQHHENEDGSGYPEGITGEKIYELAKVVHICDYYINLISDINKNLINETIERITAQASSKFSQNVYKDFIKSIYCYPNGLPIKLNNGLNATVVMQNKNYPLRPIIGVFINNEPKLINLMDHLTLFIDKIIL
ncbi:HD-GYP domain-containing protein [Clostridium lundense]|uniref:HD-GYP domain-containing protein n=1 Tax=Clostridium lundense TaxID=319475 RepID=UPI00048A414F|nr:HD domain-containing phosphohydrolase [Clostridium lundense]